MRGFEILERARDARAKLLAVERLPGVGSDESLAAAFLLVLDAGRVLVSCETGGGVLCAMHFEDGEEVPGGMISSMEEEPWWRLLGSPLRGAWAEAEGRVLRLQLRDDDDSPRFVSLTCEGDAVRAALAPARSRA